MNQTVIVCDRCGAEVEKREHYRLVVEAMSADHEGLPELVGRWDICPDCAEAIRAGFSN